MALTQQQLEAVKKYSAEHQGVRAAMNPSPQDMIKLFSLGEMQKDAKGPSSFLSRSKESLTKRGGDIKETFQKTFTGEITPVETGFRTVGDVIGGVGDVLGAAIEPAVKPAIERIAKTKAGSIAFEKLSQGMDAYESWKGESEANDRVGEMLESVVNIADLVGAAAAGKVVGKKAVKIGSDITAKSSQVASRATRDLLSSVDDLAEKISQSNIGGALSVKAKQTKQSLKGMKENLPINTEQTRLAQQAFDSFEPQKQSAISRGLIDRDYDLIKQAQEPTKKVYKEILKAAEDFAGNRRATPPSAIAGRELRNTVQALKKQRQTVGKELGEIASNLPRFSTPKQPEILLEKLRKVPGLQGVRFTEKGIDFTDSALSGSGSKKVRQTIQNVFDDVLERLDDPKKLHLLRQELFEDLGGKKAGGIKLVATEEKAINAMREAMADIIGEVSELYKNTNKTFSQIANNELRLKKMFGDISSEDIFDVKAGTLLRRITSNAKSGQDIVEMITDTQKLLKELGVSFDVDIRDLTDFVNLLNRYYDIAPDTSLQGIISTTGMSMSKRGIIEKLFETIAEGAQATDETAKNAIRELLRP